MEFEKESSAMDMKEEMMSDAVDDVMEDEGENEEEEGEKILTEVFDELGISVKQQVCLLLLFTTVRYPCSLCDIRWGKRQQPLAQRRKSQSLDSA